MVGAVATVGEYELEVVAGFGNAAATRRLLASQFHSGSFQCRSRWPACKKMRNGLRGTVGINSG